MTVSDDYDEIDVYSATMEENVLCEASKGLDLDGEYLSGTPERLAGLLEEWTPSSSLRGPGVTNRLSLFTDYEIALELARVREGNEFMFQQLLRPKFQDELEAGFKNLTRLAQQFSGWVPIVSFVQDHSNCGLISIDCYNCVNVLEAVMRFALKRDDRFMPKLEVLAFDPKKQVIARGLLCWDGNRPTEQDLLDLANLRDRGRLGAAVTADVLSALHLSAQVFELECGADAIAYRRLPRQAGQDWFQNQPKSVNDLVDGHESFFRALENEWARRDERISQESADLPF